MTDAMQRTTFGDFMPANMEAMVTAYTSKLCKAHPDAIDEASMIAATQRMRVAIVEAVARDGGDKLINCSPASWASAIAKSAMTGLYPGGASPQVWLIPRGGKVNWQMSARGGADLAERSGWELRTGVVYSGDLFEYTEEPPDLRHGPGDRDFDDSTPAGEWAAMLGVYVVCEDVRSGRKRYAYLRKGAIERRRNVSDSFNAGRGPWIDWPIEMARKTLLSYAQARGLFPRRVLEPVERAEAIADTVAAPALPAVTSPLQAAMAAANPAPPAQPEDQGTLLIDEGDGFRDLTDEEKAAIEAEEVSK